MKRNTTNPLRIRLVALTVAVAVVFTISASASFWTQVMSSPAVGVAATGSAPSVAPIDEETYTNVAIEIPLAATDPDGDAVIFKIAQSPKYGTAIIDGGTLVYTPNGKTGTEKFSYTAIDTLGNTASPAEIKIKIHKNGTKMTYADMDGNSAHYAAIRLSQAGVITGEKIGTSYFFHPTNLLTRSEFIAMASAIAGLPIKQTVATDFADDEGLSSWAKPYISAAASCGLVSGCPLENGEAEIRGASNITLNEASVVVNNLLTERLDDYVMTFGTEHSENGDWSSVATSTLEKSKVMPESAKNQDGNAPITRQTACELLYAAMKMMNE